MSGETADSEKPSGTCRMWCRPQSGAIHGSYWILRKVETRPIAVSLPGSMQRCHIRGTDGVTVSRLILIKIATRARWYIVLGDHSLNVRVVSHGEPLPEHVLRYFGVVIAGALDDLRIGSARFG